MESQYSKNPSIDSKDKLSIQKLNLSYAGTLVFSLLYQEIQQKPRIEKIYFHFSKTAIVHNSKINLDTFKAGLYELLVKKVIYKAVEDFTYFVNVNFTNIKINEDCLAILRYTDTSLQKIEVDYVQITNTFLKEISDFKLLFINENKEYTINDLEKLSEFFKLITLQQLNMEYRYCTSLSESFQGFTVKLEVEINSINTLISLLNTLDSNLNAISDDEFKQLNYNLKNYFNRDVHRDTDVKKTIHDISKSIIERYYKKLQLWITAYSIQKSYRECYDDKEILFFSHRINGWAQPVCNFPSNNKLSAEYKTNFGYGKSSYFYVLLNYDNIKTIPFCDLIKYEYAGFSEINKYTRKYKLEDNSWKEALEFLVNAYNSLMIEEAKFIKEYMIDEIDNLIFELGSLMKKTHFKFIDNLQIDENTGEVKEKEFKGVELIRLRANKITSALDFISKIKEYKKLIEIDTAIKKIEDFNIAIEKILENEIDVLNKELRLINEKIIILRPTYMDLKSTEEHYNEKKTAIKNKIISELLALYLELEISEKDYYKKRNEIITEKSLNIEKNTESTFLKENPEYDEFYTKFEPVRNEFIDLIKNYEHTEYILNDLNKYHKKILHYFA